MDNNNNRIAYNRTSVSPYGQKSARGSNQATGRFGNQSYNVDTQSLGKSDPNSSQDNMAANAAQRKNPMSGSRRIGDTHNEKANINIHGDTKQFNGSSKHPAAYNNTFGQNNTASTIATQGLLTGQPSDAKLRKVSGAQTNLSPERNHQRRASMKSNSSRGSQSAGRHSRSARRRSVSSDRDSQERAFNYPCQAFKQFLLTVREGKIDMKDLTTQPQLLDYMAAVVSGGASVSGNQSERSLQGTYARPTISHRIKSQSSPGKGRDGSMYSPPKESIQEVEEEDGTTTHGIIVGSRKPHQHHRETSFGQQNGSAQKRRRSRGERSTERDPTNEEDAEQRFDEKGRPITGGSSSKHRRHRRERSIGKGSPEDGLLEAVRQSMNNEPRPLSQVPQPEQQMLGSGEDIMEQSLGQSDAKLPISQINGEYGDYMLKTGLDDLQPRKYLKHKSPGRNKQFKEDEEEQLRHPSIPKPAGHFESQSEIPHEQVMDDQSAQPGIFEIPIGSRSILSKDGGFTKTMLSPNIYSDDPNQPLTDKSQTQKFKEFLKAQSEHSAQFGVSKDGDDDERKLLRRSDRKKSHMSEEDGKDEDHHHQSNRKSRGSRELREVPSPEFRGMGGIGSQEAQHYNSHKSLPVLGSRSSHRGGAPGGVTIPNPNDTATGPRLYFQNGNGDFVPLDHFIHSQLQDSFGTHGSSRRNYQHQHSSNSLRDRQGGAGGNQDELDGGYMGGNSSQKSYSRADRGSGLNQDYYVGQLGAHPGGAHHRRGRKERSGSRNGSNDFSGEKANKRRNRGTGRITKISELEDRLKQQILYNPGRPLDYNLMKQIQDEAAKVIQKQFRLHRDQKKADIVRRHGNLVDRQVQTDAINMWRLSWQTNTSEADKFKRFFFAVFYTYMMMNTIMADTFERSRVRTTTTYYTFTGTQNVNQDKQKK